MATINPITCRFLGCADLSRMAHGYCQRHYQKLRNESIRAANPNPSEVPGSDQDRFWFYVDRSGGPGSCWTWGGHRRKNYGYFRMLGKAWRAHRISWAIHQGTMPPAHLFVCHHCDNPPCVNPDHLFLGTTDDNMADMVRKGRQARGERNGHHTKPWSTVRGDQHASRRYPERRPRGSKHAEAKLTEVDVLEIRAEEYVRGCIPRIAARYGVSAALVSRIRLRKCWRHV